MKGASMSDLISREEVIKALKECHLDEELFEKDVFERINGIPTAYDVEAVVTEIKALSASTYVDRQKTINIVRRGVAEQALADRGV